MLYFIWLYYLATDFFVLSVGWLFFLESVRKSFVQFSVKSVLFHSVQYNYAVIFQFLSKPVLFLQQTFIMIIIVSANEIRTPQRSSI